jgi:DNA-binding beta-propeller fold protein YncE
MSLENTLAVISQSGCSLSFFNLTSGERVLHITNLRNQPHEIAYDTQTKRLFISHTYEYGFYNKHGNYAHHISVFDVKKQAVVHVIDLSPYRGPHGIKLSSDAKVLYVAIEDGFGEDGLGGVIGIDVTNNEFPIVKAVPSAARSHWLVLVDDSSKAYTTNKETKYISVLDLATERLLKKIPFPGSEEGDVSSDGNFVYYPFPTLSLTSAKPADEFGFKVIDTRTNEIVTTVLTDVPVMAVKALSREKILVTHFAVQIDSTSKQLVPLNSKVSIYNTRTWKSEGEVEVGLFPLTTLIADEGKTAYVANMASGTVDVIDISRKIVRKTLKVDDGVGKIQNAPINQGAHGMALIS